jgi:hypothetical protein
VVIRRREESNKLRANKFWVIAEPERNERAVKDEQTIKEKNPAQ